MFRFGVQVGFVWFTFCIKAGCVALAVNIGVSFVLWFLFAVFRVGVGGCRYYKLLSFWVWHLSFKSQLRCF